MDRGIGMPSLDWLKPWIVLAKLSAFADGFADDSTRIVGAPDRCQAF